ncbi:EAL domain-containing protein [Billgrantia gudaonensis]|uniref:EAL domain-containing protein n=1 Tax=Billgrantia gudaonensis TaxID=376427 RepID=A0A3S0Q0U3_9GAMM|nr:EAL domain-containing protein [Halomonas gudaonensis]
MPTSTIWMPSRSDDPLRDQGVRLALDDFGTGHTAFRLLQRLPFMAVKMDRSCCWLRARRAGAGGLRRHGSLRRAWTVRRGGGSKAMSRPSGLPGWASAKSRASYARPMELDDFLAVYGAADAPVPCGSTCASIRRCPYSSRRQGPASRSAHGMAPEPR